MGALAIFTFLRSIRTHIRLRIGKQAIKLRHYGRNVFPGFYPFSI